MSTFAPGFTVLALVCAVVVALPVVAALLVSGREPRPASVQSPWISAWLCDRDGRPTRRILARSEDEMAGEILAALTREGQRHRTQKSS